MSTDEKVVLFLDANQYPGTIEVELCPIEFCCVKEARIVNV